MALSSSRRRSTSGSSSSLDDLDDQNNTALKEEQKANQNPSNLPQDFLVKYLGKKDARGLWGIKHTRKPVDDMVGLARGLGPGAPLPYLQLSVSHRGVLVTPHKNNTCNTMDCGMYPIDTISYGVQDLVYTRVFAMIIVKEASQGREDPSHSRSNPFQCHAFVCDSRQTARRLTFALAGAFKIFSKSIKSNQVNQPAKFAIDLRSPEEMEEDIQNELDSEA
eukprot:TRINITY_DN4817_c0_g1_i1.p1 TRINITY_DN4817_c0_g1~~TRINITY_DN4817_c0_g1_i1.p1  ORF type:complete len:221 (+),score=67.34 TRINITY_DN4817_c0_g1_i1:77-739(+)